MDGLSRSVDQPPRGVPIHAGVVSRGIIEHLPLLRMHHHVPDDRAETYKAKPLSMHVHP